MESPWISAIVIVNFEIEKGQEVELIHPNSFELSSDELKNLSFMSFPDSSNSKKETTIFHFRLRSKKIISKALIEFNKDCKHDCRADNGHFWGYVCFRQVKDTQRKRGYFQKSFVLLSRLPFHNFFYELVSLWAKQFFQDSESTTIISNYNAVLAWPNLLANSSYKLPILGHTFQLFIPAESTNSHRTNTHLNNLQTMQQQDHKKEEDSTNNNKTSYIPISLASVNELDIFGAIHVIIHYIQLIWELVLLGEPILVIAQSPTESSILVQALQSIIAPLEYSYEVFPYFTIHNQEFHEFANASKPSSVILGCTNPYFAKTLSTMHTIKINETLQSGNEHLPHRKLEKVKNAQKLMDSTNSSIYTHNYKPFLQKDKQFIKKILSGVKTRRPSGVQSIIFRRYFLELTQSFMIPLERYINSLMPLLKDISAFRSPPEPAPFNEECFLATLELSGPQLTSTVKGDYEGLYKKFFTSANFLHWYENRRLEQLRALEELHQEAIAKEDFNKWIRGKQEVEIVDMILLLKNKLQLPVNSNSTINPTERTSVVKRETREMLLKKLDFLLCSLPDDLKTILN